MTTRGLPVADRLWMKVDAAGDCWMWTGTILGNGYGQFWDGDRKHLAHRYVWEELVGPIPEGLQIDHLCRTRGCVNPDHLEPVTPEENRRRAPTGRLAFCLRGHPLTPDNEYRRINERGIPVRNCRACSITAGTRRYWRLKAERQESCISAATVDSTGATTFIPEVCN